ncbi:hypothetical protein PoB_005137800 [Plakobranchus ocellatus]|uniref:Uncharacterized protein n=1 Tax=Plakobranchus ocellatus TaxID=259542 RepID=A0AAV4C0B9_9GAST|nr:hypothetical protein PoB_005137800 [Plakobranchus ocellatus]
MVVEGQYREIQRAIYGMGELVLVNEYKEFGVPRDIWFTKDNKQRARHMKRYALCIKESLSRSSNSQKVAVEPKHKGKKPGQRKRKRAGKTASFPLAKKPRQTNDLYSSDEFV